jgi:hypothetical protein
MELLDSSLGNQMLESILLQKRQTEMPLFLRLSMESLEIAMLWDSFVVAHNVYETWRIIK